MFRELFVVDGTNTTAYATPTISFNTPSSKFFGVPSSATVTGISWPFDSTAGVGSSVSSKMVMKFTAGYAATWSSIGNLGISDGVNNFVVLWTNSKLNKIIMSMVSKANGASTTLSITGLTNPYPYQQSAYNTAQTFTLSFFYNYFLNTLASAAQPGWIF